MSITFILIEVCNQVAHITMSINLWSRSYF